MSSRCVHAALAWICLMACSSPRPPSPPAEISRPRIVAHRGASHDAPENTLAAFRRAWELGAESVELDVRVTRDGAVVVIHDATTRRTAGLDRPVAEQTLAELRTLDAGAWKSPAFAGERIPTLAEALALLPRGRTLFVEIKSEAATVPAIAKAILAADPRPRGGQLALQGYEAATLAAAAAALPGVPAYWTVDPPVDDQRKPLPYPRSFVDEVQRHGFPGVALDYRGLDDELLAALRAAGIIVDVWTINDAAQLEAWLARDVRWIETDRPDLAPVR